ncbi:hypothetical protein RNI52_34480 [Labrys neptuniae]|uniref:hypothetical protein n=1 Tax=Labrys neptuniae TaxID=376174 RepID=UPI002890444F|nr:hypothetical protein [Labrys neptuniae]MDT3382484.1 hypothetical protein [Labrys neptuniae]
MSTSARTTKRGGKPQLVFAEPGIRSIDHPKHGPVVMAQDLFNLLGQRVALLSLSTMLRKLGVPTSECVLISPVDVTSSKRDNLPIHGTIFLTRTAVHLVMMSVTSQKTQAFREWLAEEVISAILDTGSYSVE